MRTTILLGLTLLTACSDASPRYVVQGQAAGAPVLQAVPQTTTALVGTRTTTVGHVGSGGVAVTPPQPQPQPQPGRGGFSIPVAQRPQPTQPITIGEGPVVGQTARGDVKEHFRDWQRSDLLALDPIDARYANDGLRESRDLIAVYARRDADTLFFRADVLDLGYGAELGGLDVVVLVAWSGQGSVQLPLNLREQTAHPYDVALVLRDTVDVELVSARGGATGLAAPDFELSWRSDFDAFEFGLDLDLLRSEGWAGQDLTFQVLTVKDGEDRIADAALEVDLLDRSLDAVVHESWGAPRAAAISPVLVGNRAALTASYLSDLVYSTQTRTAEGRVTGLHRTLETHRAHGVPVNVHLSGVLTSAIGWAKGQDPRQDGAAFLTEVAQFFDGDPANGEGAFLPGTHVDNVLPYFEGAPNQRFIAQAQRVYDTWLGVTQPGPVFWTPERIIRGSTFQDITAAGFTHTVIDQEHLQTWFGAPTAVDGKLHKVNGVECFVIDPSANLFSQTDGGPSLALRTQLIERLLSPSTHQVIVTVADWEKYAGHNGDSSTPDTYDRVIQWLSNHPWVEVADLTDLATRGWTAVDHGVDPTLPVEAHAWLRHATEASYDHWYYGHPLEESFAGLQPEIRSGRPHARAMGDVFSPGTLLGDTWSAIQSAPAGALRDTAEAAFSAGLYRTAWHQEDMHDLTRLTNGQYLNPDHTYDQLSGFVFALATRTGEAATTAFAAGWAAAPPSAPRTEARDVDLDGEDEYLLMDDRLLLVFERDGGRITAGFARDPQTGEGFQVLGAPGSYPSANREVGFEDAQIGAARNSALKEVWAAGPDRDYVNDTMTPALTPTALQFTSTDGLIVKQIAWSAPGHVEVTYDLDPSVTSIYIRAGLNPDLGGLFLHGQGGLTQSDQGGVYEMANTTPTGTVAVRVGYADAGHNAAYNPGAGDGTASSPRNTAFQHVSEFSGQGPRVQFSLAVEVR